MISIQFPAEWALRSSILIMSGALLLLALRVKDSSVRLAVWTALLCGSLAIPPLTMALPRVPITMLHAVAVPAGAPAVVDPAPEFLRATARSEVAAPVHVGRASGAVDWSRAALALYALVSLALFLRICVGLAMSRLLLRKSRATDRATFGIGIRESDRVASPVTLGIVRPAIVLPADWRQWDDARLNAVLAHERSHIRRRDPAVQLVSAIHRALLWHSPLSWFLHKRIVCVAEEASDDAAVVATSDRAFYAETLLGFMQRGVRNANWLGVPMARYGRAEGRIQRILDGTALSRGVTRSGAIAILALGSPLAYVVATAYPQSASPVQTPAAAPAVVPNTQSVGSPAVTPQLGGRSMGLRSAAKPGTQSVAPGSSPRFLVGLGNVTAVSVRVVPEADGRLASVNFKEGESVQKGEVLALIDQRPSRPQIDRADERLQRDKIQLAEAREKLAAGSQSSAVATSYEQKVAVDEADLEQLRQLSLTEIVAPITGVAGLLRIQPGSMVHAGDPEGIVTINQVQPIAVLFTVPEDVLPQVRRLLGTGPGPVVEAWNRTNSEKIATGHLTAIDNQIDDTNGTIKLKATFDNKDGALFPNQFVNVKLLVSSQ
jgi:RND family efflux transporter MFP subunit